MTMRHNNDDAGYQYTRLVYTKPINAVSVSV